MKKHTVDLGVCILIFAISFTDLRVIYAPFQYAPSNWGTMLFQGLILGIVHTVCCVFPILMRWPRLLIIIVSLLSTNTAFWASARELSFTIALDQTYLVAYDHLYLITILISLAIFFFWWKKSNSSIIKRDGYGLIFILGITYFVSISFLPLYKKVYCGNLWLAAYLYRAFQIMIISLFTLYLVLRLYKTCLAKPNSRKPFNTWTSR